MSLPQRRPVSLPEGRLKPNPLELSTIQPPPKRPPYVFKTDAPSVAPKHRPYVFPDEVSDPEASARATIRLFEVRGIAQRALARPAEDDPWVRVSRSFESETDPEAIAALLAELLAHLESLAQQRQERLSRVLPAAARCVPPLSIALALFGGYWALAKGLPLVSMGVWAPWAAALLAVPTGLSVASLVLGRLMRPLAPGEGLQIGSTFVRVVRSGLTSWRVEAEDGSKQRIPYYLAVYARTQRLPGLEKEV